MRCAPGRRASARGRAYRSIERASRAGRYRVRGASAVRRTPEGQYSPLYDAFIESPSLDSWLPNPSLRVAHERQSTAEPRALWQSAQSIRLSDTRMLGRLVRWRIPGVPADASFDELFTNPPFTVLHSEETALISGLVGRIWTLRRDYPQLTGPEEFREWSRAGTARVLFAHWVEPAQDGRTALRSEARVQALGAQGRVGVAAVRPLVRAFANLIASDGIELAVGRAEHAR